MLSVSRSGWPATQSVNIWRAGNEILQWTILQIGASKYLTDSLLYNLGSKSLTEKEGPSKESTETHYDKAPVFLKHDPYWLKGCSHLVSTCVLSDTSTSRQLKIHWECIWDPIIQRGCDPQNNKKNLHVVHHYLNLVFSPAARLRLSLKCIFLHDI